MTKKEYGGKVLKLLAIFGLPLVGLMWISSAMGKDKKPEPKPEPKPEDLVPSELKAGLGRWIEQDGSAATTRRVAWYFQGWWIAVDVYTDTVEIEEKSNPLLGPMARTINYRARFRWLVMLPPQYETPLAVGDVTGEGSASSVAPSEETTDEARSEAAQVAANAAAAWLEAFRKSKEG